MNETDVLKILEGVGAVITNSHIVYTSGKHGSAYINKDALYPHTKKTSILCRTIAKHYEGDDIEAVIAPAVGGVILATWTAYHLSEYTGRDVLCTYADKATINGEDDFVIKRGYDKIVANKNVLVVEDLLTTGGSVRKVVVAVRKTGGRVVGAGVLCNRGGVTHTDICDVPRLVVLANIKMDAWDEKDCPLCKQGVPINTSIGHGKAFLARKQE
ncbi:MAG: phosphoribosyltransferase family protein [Candidatus Parcubacteria bacterium]|nr:phosphoribosyltransferase family protein [Candidatus Parcubacteria bacterium]